MPAINKLHDEKSEHIKKINALRNEKRAHNLEKKEKFEAH